MFVILLKFSDNQSQAGEFMEDHKAWIRRGIDDGVFLVVGGPQPNPGGGILAHDCTLEEITSRVGEDPFVARNLVTAEIHEIKPSFADERIGFLLD